MGSAETFLASLGTQAGAFAALPDLGKRLAALLDGAHAAWPQVNLDDAVFLRHLADKVRDADDPGAELASIHAGDLFLACACAAGDPVALRTFEVEILAGVEAFLPRYGPDAAFIDEVKQHLRTRLLMATGGRPPRIAEFGGQGPLGGWLRVAATRAAIDLHRASARDDRHAQDRPVGAGDAPDPEMEYLKLRCREEFQHAFEETLGALSAREGNVLRLYFMNGMTAEAIARLYDVSLRTIRRWISETRQRVFDETRLRLAQRMNVAVSQIDTAMDLAQSQVELHLSEILKRTE